MDRTVCVNHSSIQRSRSDNDGSAANRVDFRITRAPRRTTFDQIFILSLNTKSENTPDSPKLPLANGPCDIDWTALLTAMGDIFLAFHQDTLLNSSDNLVAACNQSTPRMNPRSSLPPVETAENGVLSGRSADKWHSPLCFFTKFSVGICVVFSFSLSLSFFNPSFAFIFCRLAWLTKFN